MSAARPFGPPQPQPPPPSKARPVTITIDHNPACGTSRNVLSMIRASGEEPEVAEYLTKPPSRERLAELIARAGLMVHEAVRQKGAPFEAMGLAEQALTDDQVLDAMLAHPILINRPFVETPLGVRLARPSEVVLEVLENPPPEFTKEDGEAVRGQPQG
jgi:arsenate reductase